MIEFDKTKPMSTYLIAFVVSNFEMKSKLSDKYGIRMDVAARPQAIRDGLGDLALNVSGLILDFFADYFEVPYPLPKSSNWKNFLTENLKWFKHVCK